MELDQKALFALLALKMAQRMLDPADAAFAARMLAAAGLPEMQVQADVDNRHLKATLDPAQAERLFADLHAWVRTQYPALYGLGTANLAFHAGQILAETLAEGCESLQQAEISSRRPRPAA